MDALCNLILRLYRAAKETPVDEFQELALALVRASVPFHTAIWGAGEKTEGGLITHCVHLHNEPPELSDEFAYANRYDTVVDEVVANPGRTLIFHAPTRYSDPKYAVLQDYTQRFGHQNGMVITTMSRSQPKGQWLSLYRSDKHSHFAQSESRVLENIMPHLIEALEINRMLGQVHSPVQGGATMAGTRALVRMDGTLYHCGKRFAELLREVWPEWNSGRLPATLMTALLSKSETVLAGRAITVSSSMLGGMLMLNVRRVSPLHRLSPRELEVAQHYVQGESYKEIGLLLDISPATVRNFIQRIYSKLEICNKVELISVLSPESQYGADITGAVRITP